MDVISKSHSGEQLWTLVMTHYRRLKMDSNIDIQINLGDRCGRLLVTSYDKLLITIQAY